jgi:hypothetical protein
MTRGDDEVWLGKFRTSRKRGANAPKNTPLPCDRNAMDFTGRTPLYRLGKTKRLVFMAGLAVTDQPKSE